jgi:phage/plasmid-associated DNA primase
MSRADLVSVLAKYGSDRGNRHGFSVDMNERYYIAAEHLTDFWQEILVTSYNRKTELYEVMNSFTDSAMAFQISFDWPTELGYITDNFKKTLTCGFQEIIRDRVGPTPSYQDCCIVEYHEQVRPKFVIDKSDKKAKKRQRTYRSIIRVIFPNLVIPYSLQQDIFNQGIMLCRLRGLTQWLTCAPLDSELINISMLLHEKYLRVILPNMTISLDCYHQLDPEIDGYNIADYSVKPSRVFDLARHKDVRDGLIKLRELKIPVASQISLFLSRSYGLECGIKYQRQAPKFNIDRAGEKTAYHYDDDEEKSIIFLDMMSPDRFTNRMCFMEVGRALHKIYKGDDHGRIIWFEYTLRACKGEGIVVPDHIKNLDDYHDVYVTFGETETGIDVKTLAWYAKIDSPDAYNNWHDNWVLEAINKAIWEPSNYNAAVIFCRLCWLDVLTCSSGDSQRTSWYIYHESIWRRSNNNVAITGLFSNRLIKRMELMQNLIEERFSSEAASYDQERQELQQEAREDFDEHELQTRDEQVKNQQTYLSNFKKLMFKVKSNGFMVGSFKYAAAMLEVDSFDRLANQNGNLTAFRNGVVESSYLKQEIIFRMGKPQDYLTLSTWRDFPVKYNDRSPQVKRCRSWMKKLYPGLMYNHVNKLYGSFYVAGNLHKIMCFFVGPANGGKSSAAKALECWGDYMSIFPFSFLTSPPPKAESPFPLLLSFSGPRVSITQETDDKRLQPETIKMIAGNDALSGRKLFSNDIQRLPSTTIVIACMNWIPPSKGFDAAVKTRVKIFPHTTVFVDNAPLDKAKQKELRRYPKDPSFNQQVRTLSDAMLWMAFHFFPIYAKEGLEDPPEVIEATQSYWDDTDPYLAFIAEHLQEVVDEDGEPCEDVCVAVEEVYRRFIKYYARIDPTGYPPNRNSFDHHMIDHLRVPSGKKWCGMQFIGPEYPEFSGFGSGFD